MPHESHPLPSDHAARMERVRLALDGLSIGDALGQQFFHPAAWALLPSRSLPPPPWRFTDDTEMALAIAEVLDGCGRIDQDRLAATFARRYAREPHRGYGAGAARILAAVHAGGDWRSLSAAAFGGQGSLGNGAAMRAAPLGAYFAGDLPTVAAQARAAAEVTHQHPEGVAGGIAAAVAAACASDAATAGEMLQQAAAWTPPGATRDGIRRAAEFPPDAWEHDVAAELGNGQQISAPDTVPFCLWCAAARRDNYAEALWTAIRVGGDIDTNGAIVGGIVALAVGRDGLPDAWLRSREGLSRWTGSRE